MTKTLDNVRAVSPKLAESLARLKRTAEAVSTPEREARTAAKLESMDATIEAGKRRPVIDRAEPFLNEVMTCITLLRKQGRPIEQIKTQAAKIIARNLCRTFEQHLTDADAQSVIRIFDRYGGEPTRDAAAAMIREGKNTRVQSIFGVLSSRSKQLKESVPCQQPQSSCETRNGTPNNESRTGAH